MCHVGFKVFLNEAQLQGGLTREREVKFVDCLCDPKLSVSDVRDLLSRYMEITSSLYLESLVTMLDKRSDLFQYALLRSRHGWHRRYRDRKFLCKGSSEDILALQKVLLERNIRLLFAYAVNFNIGLLPEALTILKQKVENEAAENGVTIGEQIAKRGVSYAVIYDYQLSHMDRMRK